MILKIQDDTIKTVNKINKNMKKIIFLTGILILAITLSGCGRKNGTTEANPALENETVQADTENNESEKSVFNSIKEALGSQKTLECTFVSGEEDLNVEVKSYVQGEKYKTEFMVDGKKNYSVFDGKVSHSWEEGSTQGVKIDIECLKSLGESSEDEESEESPTEEEPADVFEGAQNVECRETGKADFSIPEGINFMDQCEMLKNQQRLINELDGQIPAGLPRF